MKIFDWMLRRGEYRASPENPSTNLSNPASWLVDLAGGGVADSGVPVGPESAIKYSAVYSCVRVIAETIASLPLFVYERDGRVKRKARDNKIYKLLQAKPNSEQTAFCFKELLSVHANLWGNAYAFIQRDNAARPIELIPLLPDRTKVERYKGKKRYSTTVNGTRLLIDPSDILHIPAISLDGLQGLSPIGVARQAIGLGIATERFGSKLFSNNGRPSGVLEHPGTLGADGPRNIEAEWNRKHQGLDNAHRVAVLQEGMTWKPMTIPPEDAQFLQTRKFQVNEIARIFRVPPHMIGDLDKATFSNIEHQAIEFVVHTIRPWLVRFEQEINSKLFGENEKGLFAEFKVDALLRGDTKSRFESYAIARNWGWLSANDIRSLENLNPIKGGDMYLRPLNMEAVGTKPQQLEKPKQANSLEPFKGLFQDALRRVVKREIAEVRRLMAKEKFNPDEYYEGFDGVVRTALKPVFEAFVASGGCSGFTLDGAVDYFRNDSIGCLAEASDNIEKELKRFESEKAESYSNIFGGFENES